MSQLDDTTEFRNDYVFIKFKGLKDPVGIPWIEVGAGTFVEEESNAEQFVFVTQKAEAPIDEVSSASVKETLPQKTVLSKAVLIRYLESQLRDPADPNVADYGPIEDIKLQPAKKDLTKEVYIFLAKHENA